MRRILFVDDDENILSGLRNLLRKERRHWEMVFASGGNAALAECSKAPFDIIVSDMRMPGMDGTELLEKVKEFYPKTTRIILSGYAEREAVMRALPVAHQFLSKPCDVDVLRVAIERSCEIQDLLCDQSLRQMVGKLDKIPSDPKTYRELTRAVANHTSDAAAVARILETDPAMSAKLLQIANSAYFGPAQRMTSVTAAVAYLGTDLVKSLALMNEVFASADDQEPGTAFSVERLQRHSLATATLVRRLVGGSPIAEEAFTAALLHDIGKLVLRLAVPDAYRRVRTVGRETGLPPHQLEKEVIGVTHAEVGAYLLGVWGLPNSIVEAVAYHHRPSELQKASSDVLALVHLADALVASATEVEPESVERRLLDSTFLAKTPFLADLPRWRTLAASAT